MQAREVSDWYSMSSLNDVNRTFQYDSTTIGCNVILITGGLSWNWISCGSEGLGYCFRNGVSFLKVCSTHMLAD